jgi:glutamate dehydrogenase
MYAYEDLMTSLESEGMLDRAVEFLPSSEEMAERRRAGRGMERPELAVLLAYAKRSVTEALLRSDLPDDPYVDRDLGGYFPPAIGARFGHLLGDHPLRRELVATIVANDVVNSLGPTFVARLVAEHGMDPAAVVRAYVVARDIIGARERWEAVERLAGSVEVDAQWELMVGVDWLVEATARWFLSNPPTTDLGTAIAAGRDAFRRLAELMPELRSEEWRAAREQMAGELAARGVPQDVAHVHAFQPALIHAPDVIAVAAETGRPLEEVARAFFLVGDSLRIEWLEREIDALPAATRLQRWAVHAVRDDVLRARRELVERALREAPREEPVHDAVDRFLGARRAAAQRLEQFERDLSGENGADLAGLSLAVRHLRALGD